MEVWRFPFNPTKRDASPNFGRYILRRTGVTNVAKQVKELPKEAVKTATTETANAVVDEQKKKQNH